MSKRALELASTLDPMGEVEAQAAEELRRLVQVNQRLVSVLKECQETFAHVQTQLDAIINLERTRP